MYLLVAKQLVIMMLIVVLGFFFSKRNKFGGKETEFLSRLLLYFVNPCLIINAFNLPYDSVKFRQLGVALVISFGVHLVITLVVTICIHSKGAQEKEFDALDKIGIVFTNCGFIGIPLIKGVFGDGGVFFLMGYIAVFNIYLWTYGEYLMSRKIALKKVITNPNVIAVIAGIILFCMPFTLPDIIAKPLSYIADLNTALSMILLGMLFGSFSKTESGISYTKRVIVVSVLRLVVSSCAVLAFLSVMKIVFAGVPDIREMLFVVYIASLCPIGMSVSTFACVFNRNASYTSLIVSVTSVACIITVPLFVRLAELIL
jgi:malate permease and related proteins